MKTSTRFLFLKFGFMAFTAFTLLDLSLAYAQNKPVSAKLPDWSGTWAATRTNGNGGSGGSTGGIMNRAAKITNPYSYTPSYQAMYEKNVQGENGEIKANDPGTNCVPPGMPKLLLMPYPIEFMITAEKVLILHEYHGETRRIFTDGRKHPPADELAETYVGHSIGHWEADTLVVDTVGFKTNAPQDRTNVHSDVLHMVERIRRIGDKLEDQVTLDDAKAFTKPWTSTFSWDHKTGEEWDIKEYVCQENNRNPSDAITGKPTITPGSSANNAAKP